MKPSTLGLWVGPRRKGLAPHIYWRHQLESAFSLKIAVIWLDNPRDQPSSEAKSKAIKPPLLFGSTIKETKEIEQILSIFARKRIIGSPPPEMRMEEIEFLPLSPNSLARIILILGPDLC